MNTYKYLDLRVHMDSDFRIVGMWENGVDLGEKAGFMSKPTFPELYERIGLLGKQGWELVTVSGPPLSPIYHFKQQD
ncbi:MAG: hypothetical protein ACK2U1_06520 [Anaerolineales bacterium]